MNVLPTSGSVVSKAADRGPAGWFSATLLADRAMSVGVSLTLVTVIVKAFSKDRPPWSVVRTRML